MMSCHLGPVKEPWAISSVGLVWVRAQGSPVYQMEEVGIGVLGMGECSMRKELTVALMRNTGVNIEGVFTSRCRKKDQNQTFKVVNLVENVCTEQQAEISMK